MKDQNTKVTSEEKWFQGPNISRRNPARYVVLNKSKSEVRKWKGKREEQSSKQERQKRGVDEKRKQKEKKKTISKRRSEAAGKT